MGASPTSWSPVAAFEWIYATDLVYEEACWRRCGDAHCCHFSRYKDRFLILGKGPTQQELILLPGELDFLRSRGWLAQFADVQCKEHVFELGPGQRWVAEWLRIPADGCPCEHAIRPTFCRLYPLLPVFDVDGRLRATAPLVVYEDLEDLDGLARACALDSLPFGELDKWLAICSAIADEPRLLFFMMAYHRCRQLLRETLRRGLSRDDGQSAFRVFEMALLRGELIEAEVLRRELSGLAEAFERRYGRRTLFD